MLQFAALVTLFVTLTEKSLLGLAQDDFACGRLGPGMLSIAGSL
jgi:hypothetical protein